MFNKVFNRGHKAQIKEPESLTASNIPSQSNYRRHSSLRHSQYYGHSEDFATLATSKPSASKNYAHFPKKYVSCENVRQVVEEYQDVNDEVSTDDENGLKEKIAKRYNSLTTLLMKSFRKAKIKKKKEAMMSETGRSNHDTPTIYESNERPNGFNRNSLTRRNSIAPNDTTKMLLNAEEMRRRNPREPDNTSVKSRGIASLPPVQRKLESERLPSDQNEQNSTDNQQDESDESDEPCDESVPVFIGVKMISNEFVDLKPQTPKQQPVQVPKSPVSLASTSKSSESTLNRVQEKIINETSSSNKTSKSSELNYNRVQERTINETSSSVKTAIEKFEAKSQAESRSRYSTLNTPKTTQEQVKNQNTIQKPSLNQTIVDAINDSPFQKKDQETKVDGQAKINFSSAAKRQAPKPPVAQNSPKPQHQTYLDDKKNLHVKRSKTFTEQLQDILMERKRTSVQKHSELKEESFYETHRQESVQNSPKILQNSKILNETNNISNNKSMGYYDTIDSIKSNYHQNFYESNLINQIKTFNESSMCKENLVNELFDLNEISLNNFEKDDTPSDDFNDLVQVLARQDNCFKKKFFQCLMTKLWDTTLPYNEYMQLNKLMTALFGENYHKFDQNYMNHSSSHQSRVSKYNSEHVVKLVKMFLDSSDNENLSRPSVSRAIPNDDLDSEYISVSNLISTLKRRQHYESLSHQVESFNSRFDQLIKPEKKVISIEPEIDFEKIKFLNGIDVSKSELASNKPSISLQLSQKEEINQNFDPIFNQIKENILNTQVYDSPELTNEYSYFSRNRMRRTLGNFDSLLSHYTTNTRIPSKSEIVDSSSSFSDLKFTTLQRPDTSEIYAKPNLTKPISLKSTNNNNSTKTSGIIASFQPASQFIAHEPKRSNNIPQVMMLKKETVVNLKEQTKIGSKVINLTKQQTPPKPKIIPQELEKEGINLNTTKIRSVRELFKNEENLDRQEHYRKKNEITMVKTENIVYSQFDKTRQISNTLPLNKPVMTPEAKTLNLKTANPYSTAKNLAQSGIYSTLGSRKDGNDVIFYHPKQFPTKNHQFENSIYQQIREHSESKRIYEQKSTKGYQLSQLIAEKISKYDGREMKQAYY